MATTSSNLVTIREAIIYGHDEMHNSKALTKDQFLELGLTEQAYNQWVAYVTELRKTVYNYNMVAQAKDAVKAFKSLGLTVKSELTEQKAIATVEGAVWAAWRDVLKQGTVEDFNRHFFVRKADIAMLCGYCGLTKTNTAKGPKFAPQSVTEFRKRVEMCIGIRMTGDGMLTDEAKDVITAYEKAVAMIQAKKAAIADSKDTNGKVVLGLENGLAYEQGELEKSIATLKDNGITDEKVIENITAAQQAKVDKLQEELDAAKEALKKAESTKADNEEKYSKTIALLHSIGDDYQ